MTAEGPCSYRQGARFPLARECRGRGAARFLPPQERRKGGDGGGRGLRGSCRRWNDGKAGMAGAEGCDVPAVAGTTESWCASARRWERGSVPSGRGGVRQARRAEGDGGPGAARPVRDAEDAGDEHVAHAAHRPRRVAAALVRRRGARDGVDVGGVGVARATRSDGGLPLRHAVEQAERRLGGRSGVAGAGPGAAEGVSAVRDAALPRRLHGEHRRRGAALRRTCCSRTGRTARRWSRSTAGPCGWSCRRATGGRARSG